MQDTHLGAVAMETRYEAVCRDAAGRIKWTATAKNLVVTAGLNKLIDACFKTGLASPAWYLGLKSTGTPNGGRRLASHATWTELTAYDEATRPAFTAGTVSAGSVSNSASKARFTASGSMTVLGLFLTDINTKSRHDRHALRRSRLHGRLARDGGQRHAGRDGNDQRRRVVSGGRMANLGIVNERASALYTAVLKDETGAVIDGTALDSLTLTVYEAASGTILNGRDAQNVKNTNGVTITAGGALTWVLDPADNAVLGTGPSERHVALFIATWASGAKKCPHELTWHVRNLAKQT